MSKTVLAFIADTHYYSKTLGTSGGAYRLRSDSDQKCLGETAEIIDAAFEMLSESDCDAVMLAGDLTNDGERVCHEEFRERLRELKKKKPVYAVTATHDWCSDGNPRRYEGDKALNDVPTLNHNELYDFYREFGTDDARAQYRTTLGPASYTVDIGENVTLLALNDDKNGSGHAGFKKSHLRWIKEQIEDAVSRGRLPVAMEHHLLYPHISPIITGGACCRDREKILNEFADAGLRLVVVGHSHIQRIDRYVSPAGNEIFEVNVGSLVGYPAPILTVAVGDGDITVSTELLEKFTLNGTELKLTEYLAGHSVKMLSAVFDAIISDDRDMLKKRLDALNIKSDTVMKFYFLIAPAVRRALSATVRDTGRLLNFITAGRAMPKSAYGTAGDMRISEVIYRLYLNVLDGGRMSLSPRDELYQAVRGTLSLPYRICRKLHIGGKACALSYEIDRTADEILTGGATDNNYLYIRR